MKTYPFFNGVEYTPISALQFALARKALRLGVLSLPVSSATLGRIEHGKSVTQETIQTLTTFYLNHGIVFYREGSFEGIYYAAN